MKDFVWGAATAAYQIEGASRTDGKGESIWDEAFRQGRIHPCTDGDAACNHYTRFREDVALMREIGVQAYRFSLSWPRLLPNGTGTVNPQGLRFYHALVDELLGAGIEPYVTLFHWDLPSALHRQGGWLNPASPDWFAEYAALVAREFGGCVRNFITVNEFQSYIGLGYAYGKHAPFQTLPLGDVLRISHNSLLAHGRAVREIRKHCPNARVGVSPCSVVKRPRTRSARDVEAARRATFGPSGRNISNSAWFMDPIYLGTYPQDQLALFHDADFSPSREEMALISEPLDFFGVNIYGAETVEDDGQGGWRTVSLPDEIRTASNFLYTPDALYWGPKFFYERYRLPVLITENGGAFCDIKRDDKIRDAARCDFLDEYLENLLRARGEGTPVDGYFYWSLLDNVEWTEGTSMRFGLIYVDFATGQRYLKESALHYRNLIRRALCEKHCNQASFVI